MKHRVKKGRSGGVPGAKNPVQKTCQRGHEVWVNSKRNVIRCPICRGKK